MKTFTVNVFGVIFLVTMLAGCMNTIPEPLLTNPYPNYPYWYKAQVHVHSNRSAPDSYETPKEVLQEYKDAGYQIIALTDHDASCEDILTDPGVPGIVYIPSEEDCYSSAEHLLAIGLTGEYPYPEGEVGCGPQCGWDSNQERINWVVNTQNGIAVIAHPYWKGWDEQEILTQLYAYHGIEIYTANIGDDESKQAEILWDKLLDQGKSVWGFATDDHENNKFNMGWIVVNSNLGPSNNYLNEQNVASTQDALRQDVIENIKKGNFYSVVRILGEDSESPACNAVSTSSGPSLNVLVIGDTVTAATDSPSKFYFIVGSGKEISIDGETTTASYTLTGSETYVRVLIRRTSSQCLDQYIVYSQPLIVKGKEFSPEGGTIPQGHICKDNEKCLCGLRPDELCYSDCVPLDSTAMCP